MHHLRLHLEHEEVVVVAELVQELVAEMMRKCVQEVVAEVELEVNLVVAHDLQLLDENE